MEKKHLNKAEQLAVDILNAIDPSLQLSSKSILDTGYGKIEEGEIILCTDVEEEHPQLAAYILARDSIYLQRVRDVRPSLEAVTWTELCTSLRDLAFAGLATIYSEEYYKDIYVGTGMRRIDGKVAFVMRPATEEDKKRNKEAVARIKMLQAMYDAAHEVVTGMGGGEDGEKKKKSNSWTFH